MIRRNRRADWRRIKSLRTYTIEEAASTLGLHRGTIRYWVKKCGLAAQMDQRPHLIYGSDLVAFLKGRREANRQKCGPGHLFCLKCRKPRTPAGNALDYEPFAPTQGTLVGICPICESLMRRFVMRSRLEIVGREFRVEFSPPQDSLRDTTMPRLNSYSLNENRQ
jgi:excisionase family DNA binding protein